MLLGGLRRSRHGLDCASLRRRLASVIGERHGEADCERRSRQCAGRAEENGPILLVAKDAGKLRAADFGFSPTSRVAD
jgi:hypothetical protein